MTQFHWETQKIVDALKPLGFPITVGPPGGDFDTSNIFVKVGKGAYGGGFHIAGYTPDQALTNQDWDSWHVDAIELSDGMDSSGGLTSNDPAMIKAYADIRIILAKLIEDTNTYIIDHYDEIF